MMRSRVICSYAYYCDLTARSPDCTGTNSIAIRFGLRVTRLGFPWLGAVIRAGGGRGGGRLSEGSAFQGRKNRREKTPPPCEGRGFDLLHPRWAEGLRDLAG